MSMYNIINTVDELKLNVSEMKSLCNKLKINCINYNILLNNDISKKLYDGRKDETLQNSQWLNSNNCVVGDSHIIINYDSDTNSEIEYIPTKKLYDFNKKPDISNINIIKGIFFQEDDI